MIKRMFTGDKKTFLLWFGLVFAAISIIFLVTTMLLQADNNRDKRITVDITERSLINSEQYFIEYKIGRLISDLQFIYGTLEQHVAAKDELTELEELWRVYADSRQVYDQIRYLDADGNELIRVDYDEKGSVIAPKEKLQNKRDRYYFQQTIQMDKGQIYLSPMDLNIENGAIELPINPVIRLAKPVFDANGEKKGIVILNYSASDVLTQIDSIASGSFGEVYLLNKDSFWLYNSHSSYNEWAFAYNPASTVKFSNYYPEEWGVICAGGAGTLTSDHGYFSYATVPVSAMHISTSHDTDITCQVGDWYIVTFIPFTGAMGEYPSSDLGSLALASFLQYGIFYLTISLFSAVLAGFITSTRTKSLQVKYFSEYDAMTGAYNRHAGIDKLANAYQSIFKTDCSMSICFIDVNGLKEVNDTLGHEVGDELIVTVTNTIRAHIREDDFLIRMGGDEFLIVFLGMDGTHAEAAWSRITDEFEAINATEQRKYLVSVSHGIKTLDCTPNQLLDNLLNQADIKMYEEKRRIKSSIQIIRG